MANFEAKVNAILNESSLQTVKTKIESGLAAAPIRLINFDVNTSGIRNKIETELSKPFDIKINTNSLVSGIGNAGKQAAQSLQTSFNKVLDQGQRVRVGNLLSNMGFSPDAVKTVTDKLEKDINQFQLKVSKISQGYSSKTTKKDVVGNSSLSVQGYDELGNLVELVKKFDQAGKEISSNKRIVSTFEQQAEAAKSTAKEFAKLKELQTSINSKRESIAGLDPSKNSAQISELKSQLSDASKEYAKFYSQTRNSLSADQKDSLLHGFDAAAEKIATIKAKLADSKNELINNLNSGLGNGKSITSSFEQTVTDYEKLNSGSIELVANIEKLKTAYAEMSNQSLSDEQRLDAQQRYNDLLKETSQEIKRVSKVEQDYLKADTLQNKAQALISRTQKWMADNPKAAAEFGDHLNAIITQLGDKNLDGAQFSNLASQINSAKTAAQQMGLVTTPLVQTLKQLFGITSTVAVLQKGVHTIKQMVQETIKVDTAMTELYRVTNLSDREYANLYDNMIQSAKAYGAELDDMINSTASWVRLGFDANTANKLAEVSTMYQHVTDLDEKTAVNNLVTAYMGFKDSLLEVTNGDEVAAITRISDVFDKLGNELPVTASNVAEGLTKNASVMQSAGASLEEAAAMVVGSGSVSQDFAKSGTALKIFALRLHGAKGELEELGEEVDENVMSVTKMQTQILNLTKGAVNIFEEDGKTFRNIYDISKELSEVLPTLSGKDQAALLETVAGKSRSNDILNLLTNFKMTEKALNAAQNAAGTAAQENAIYMDSIQGRIDSLKASWQALSADFVQSDFLKALTTSATLFLNVLDAIASKLGTLGTIFAGGGIFGIVKTITSIS